MEKVKEVASKFMELGYKVININENLLKLEKPHPVNPIKIEIKADRNHLVLKRPTIARNKTVSANFALVEKEALLINELVSFWIGEGRI